MPFNFAEVKARARRVVHETLGVLAFYEDDVVSPPEEICVRWHNKIDRMGDLDNQSYAELIQGIDRIIFEAAAARTMNVKRGGVVSITFPDTTPITLAFTLMVREPADGPFGEAWEVARKAPA